jgi:radical SAM protein with 4Fe4S-binding SPASM domain
MLSFLKPRELKIEITDACNLRCTFCYLGGEVTGGMRFMPEQEVLHWIDWTAVNDVPAVRFTGGEATLHPRLKFFCQYARLRRRYIILNTNGTGDAKLYRELFRVVDDVRISLPMLDAQRMDEITGGVGMLARKRAVIETAQESGVSRIVLLTALLPELHGTLERFLQFAGSMPRVSWLPLRYESTPVLPRPWTRADAQSFAEEMADLMDRYPEQAQGIYLATPFCAVTPTNLGARVFRGRTLDCGPFAALNVNVRGQSQACFEIGEMEGIRSMEEIQDCPEIHACVSLDTLPGECRNCTFVTQCAGGCRKPYGLVQHGGKRIDYLAGFV